VGSETGQDQPLFDAITQDVAPEPSDTPLLLLDRTLRIRGCNSAYERVSRRRRDELIGQLLTGIQDEHDGGVDGEDVCA
jgi:hypothetical protein